MTSVELLEKIEILKIPDKHLPIDVQCQFFDDHPELMDTEHLNNLHLILPGGMMREEMRQYAFINNQPNPNERLSQLRLSQTTLEFWQAIDDAIIEARINIDELTQIVKEKESAFSDFPTLGSEQALRELRQMILPVYRILRERGYNTYDIIG